MFIVFEDRPSSSPYVERVWRCHSERGGPFVSVAASHLELVVTRLPGLTMVTLRGPETRATTVECPPDGHWVAIRFALGTYWPRLPTTRLLDHQDVNLPVGPDGRFWLAGRWWELPRFDTAEDLVDDLVRHGVLARDPAVEAAMQGEHQALTLRSVQRHFLHATGMTHTAFQSLSQPRSGALAVKFTTGARKVRSFPRKLPRRAVG